MSCCLPAPVCVQCVYSLQATHTFHKMQSLASGERMRRKRDNKRSEWMRGERGLEKRVNEWRENKKSRKGRAGMSSGLDTERQWLTSDF